MVKVPFSNITFGKTFFSILTESTGEIETILVRIYTCNSATCMPNIDFKKYQTLDIEFLVI